MAPMRKITGVGGNLPLVAQSQVLCHPVLLPARRWFRLPSSFPFFLLSFIFSSSFPFFFSSCFSPILISFSLSQHTLSTLAFFFFPPFSSFYPPPHATSFFSFGPFFSFSYLLGGDSSLHISFSFSFSFFCLER